VIVAQATVEPPVAAKLPPHPLLPAYYGAGGDDAKGDFVRRLFDDTAACYDRVERMMALGTGSWYRRRALRRAGLRPGMRCVDVAVGTGLVAREAIRLVGDPSAVTGVDPSTGMLAQAARALPIRLVEGRAEALPFGDGSFDFLSMGYALRHVADVYAATREFFRVLRPGGVACVLEIGRPRGRIATALLRGYMRGVVPRLSGLAAGGAGAEARGRQRTLWEYYWDTIEACVSPEAVQDALRDAGFTDVRRHVELGVFSEYTGRKPAV
jgi:demethylmenaquinone methyltransferase/2-methoxy-6-polyprenyl-1,4-benzoquinol methylase